MAAPLYDTIAVSQVTSIGRSKSAAASSSSSSRASSRRPPSAWADSKSSHEGREPGIVRCCLFDEGGQVTHGAPLQAHDGELRAKDDGGVGLADVGADPKGLQGQLFSLVGVSGYLGPRGAAEGENPIQRRLVKPFGRRRHDLETSIHLVDVPDAAGNRRAPIGGQEELHRVTEPLRLGSAASSVQVSASDTSNGHGHVENPHDDGVVTGGPSDGHGFPGQRLVTLACRAEDEFRTEGREHKRCDSGCPPRADRAPIRASRPCPRRQPRQS